MNLIIISNDSNFIGIPAMIPEIVVVTTVKMKIRKEKAVYE